MRELSKWVLLFSLFGGLGFYIGSSHSPEEGERGLDVKTSILGPTTTPKGITPESEPKEPHFDCTQFEKALTSQISEYESLHLNLTSERVGIPLEWSNKGAKEASPAEFPEAMSRITNECFSDARMLKTMCDEPPCMGFLWNTGNQTSTGCESWNSEFDQGMLTFKYPVNCGKAGVRHVSYVTFMESESAVWSDWESQNRRRRIHTRMKREMNNFKCTEDV